MPYYLLIAGERTDRFMPIPRVLHKGKHKQPYLGFEFSLTIPFITMRTSMPSMPLSYNEKNYIKNLYVYLTEIYNKNTLSKEIHTLPTFSEKNKTKGTIE